MKMSGIGAAVFAFACLVLLSVSSAEPALDAMNYDNTGEVQSIAKPDGHTNQVSPHRGASDREWYVEGRWSSGPYPVQQGVITKIPERAPIPEAYVHQEKKRPAHNYLRNNGYQGGNNIAQANGQGTASGASDSAEAANAASHGEVKMVPRRMHHIKGRRVPPPQEPRLSMQKPYGHTSQVSPHKGAYDVEWHVEARWSSGPLPVQDGEITAKPVLAKAEQ